MEEMLNEGEARKWVWRRKGIVDEAISSESFSKLSAEEQDAKVIALQLDLDQESVSRCLEQTASPEELAMLRARIAESFKYGKRAALRPLKTALSGHPYLTAEDDAKGVE